MKTSSFNQPISLAVGLLTVYFHIPECHSLKEKRSVIKPILAKIQNSYKVSVAEVGFQDRWQESMLACVIVGTQNSYCESVLQNIYEFIMDNFQNIVVADQKIELL